MCSCWIISFLFFKQKSHSQGNLTTVGQTNNSQLDGKYNIHHDHGLQKVSISSVELSHIRGTLGPTSNSTSKLCGMDVILQEDVDNINKNDQMQRGEHSSSVSELFNTVGTLQDPDIYNNPNNIYNNNNKEIGDINSTSEPGETLYSDDHDHDKRDDEVNESLAQFVDNDIDGLNSVD